MMELGIDDGEGDKSNKNNTKKEENEKNAHDLGDEEKKHHHRRPSQHFPRVGTVLPTPYTRLQYYYRQSGASEYPLTTLAILTAIFWLLASGLNSFFVASEDGNGVMNETGRLAPEKISVRRERSSQNARNADSNYAFI